MPDSVIAQGFRERFIRLVRVNWDPSGNRLIWPDERVDLEVPVEGTAEGAFAESE